MIYDIPGTGSLELKTIILDLNGTISVHGKLISGVSERLSALRDLGHQIVPFMGNTRGDASDIVVPTINDALDLLIDKDTLIATMRS